MAIPDHTFELGEDDIFLLPQSPWKRDGIKPMEWLHRNFPRFLYAPDFIVKNAVPYRLGDGPNRGGIYFLVDENGIAYVGKSNTIYKRLIQHKRSGMPFNRFWCFGGVPELFLNHVESFYIYTLEPPLNEKYPPTDDFVSGYIEKFNLGLLTYGHY